ncbi:MAG: Ig-like domain-containing protein [Verrucomicrobiota bacterium]|nr:Ig-like domain-containing protein [Verrucomicrobiota bacterium]
MFPRLSLPVFRRYCIFHQLAPVIAAWFFCVAQTIAEPNAVDDAYVLSEDRAFSVVSGPIFLEDFDGAGAGSFDNQWLILDRIENQNGRGDGYPVDSSARAWNAPDFDPETSTVTPWFRAPVPIQSGNIDGFSDLDDLLFGIDQAANGQNLVTTYLFRNTFTLTATEALIESWEMEYLIDDGIAVYVNGTEVFRSASLPAGPLTTQTFTTSSVPDESVYLTDTVNLGGLLVAGNNSIAVELHQATIESSDVGFDLILRPSPGGEGSLVHADDPFPGPYDTSEPDFAASDVLAEGGFEGTAGGRVRVGGGPQGRDTVSAGSLRVPIILENPATLEVSFRYRLLMDAGYEPDEYSTILFAAGGELFGTGQSDEVFRITGDGNGGGNDDSGWRVFSTEISLPAGTQNLDFGVYNNASTTPGEVTDALFDDILVELVGDGVNGGLLVNDSGEGSLVASLAVEPTNGVLVLNRDGTFTYVPAVNFSGMDSFTYTLTDDSGGSSSATVSLDILPVNDPPVAEDLEVNATEDTILSVPPVPGLAAIASDIENDPLTFVIDGDVSSGELNLNPDGSFEYTPQRDFFGVDSFTYFADDGTEKSLSQTVTIRVAPVNDGPNAEDDTYSTGENIPLAVSQAGLSLPVRVLSENFNTVAGAPFSGVTSLELVSGFDGVGGNQGFSGSFLRNRTSGNPAGSTSITINNLPPHNRVSLSFILAIIDSWDGDRNGGDFFNIIVDGQSIFAHTFDNAGQGGIQSYIPPPGVELARLLDLGFSQGSLYRDSAYDMGNEPVLRDIVHTAESITIEMFADGGDWEGGDDESWAIDNLEVSVYTAVTSELITAGSVWSYLDDGSDQGREWIAADYDDSQWASGPAQLGYGDGDEATTVGFGEDSDEKHPTTYFRHRFLVDNPAEFESLGIRLLHDDGAAVYINGSEVLRSNLAEDALFSDFAPATSPGENDFFLFTADASLLVAGENIIAVEIHQVSGTSSDISFDLSLEGRRPDVFGLINNDSDVEGDALSVRLLKGPLSGEVSLDGDGSFIYSPGLNFEGQDSFTYVLSDGSLEDEATVFINVVPGANDFPVTIPDSYRVDEDGRLNVPGAEGLLANDVDPESEPLVALVESLPANGSVSIEPDGAFVYSPEADFHGSDTFTYRAYDGVHASVPTVVNIEVSMVNDPPFAGDDVFLAVPGMPLDVEVPGVLAGDFDIDGDVLQAELVSQVDSGVLVLEPGGAFRYFPKEGFTGQVSFTYRVTDGLLSSAPARVVINVNTPPVAAGDNYELNEDESFSMPPAFGLLSNDSDAEGDDLTAIVSRQPANGSIRIRPDGGFTYIPDQDFSGVDSFTYAANDGLQDSPPARVNFTVVPVNDAPVARDDAYSVVIGQGISIAPEDGVLANDTDVENDPLNAILLDYSGDGDLVLRDDGSIDYMPSASFSGVDSFTYRAGSAGQSSEAATVELLVGPAAGTLIISEIMFHPSSGNESEEYIELHNTSDGPLPLLGWKFTSGVEFEFPAVVIPPGGYLVVAADPQVFNATYGEVALLAGPWRGQLSNRGERIRIEDSLGKEADELTYSDQGDWARRRAEDDPGVLSGEEGWKWDTPADGRGASLELVNDTLSNKYGQNWSAGSSPTPGAVNSVASRDTAPLVLKVKHVPAIPGSGQDVTVSAQLLDNDGNQIAGMLHWRVSERNPGDFNVLPMRDDGSQGDLAAGDGTFAAVVPGQPADTVIEFYVEATNGEYSRTWPAASDDTGRQQANALFQFDDETYEGNQPIYRLVMPVEEDEAFRFGAFNAGSDAQKNVTLIARQGTDIDVRYQCGLRIRGAGSRGRNPRNNRLNIPRDRPWNGVTKINLNTQFIYLQLLGSRFSLASGIEAATAKPVQLRHNGVNRAEDNQNARRYGSYLHVEAIDGDWAGLHYPLDPAGNIYSKGRPDVKWNIRYGEDGISPDVGAYRGDGWSKGSNESANQWDDLHELFITMNSAEGDGYLDQVSGVVDVDQWARWFAFMTIVLSRETNLSNGTDDDYKFYRGVEDARFKLIPHDFDTIFGLGDTSTNPESTLFPAVTNFAGQTFPPLVAFFNDDRVVRLYYAYLRELLETVFAKDHFDAAVVNTLDWVPQDTGIRGDIIQFMDTRRAHILEQIPDSFSVRSNLSLSEGLPRTDEAGDTGLRGTVDAGRTAEVRVNGIRVPVNSRDGTWQVGTGIEEVLLPAGANWRYLDDGSDQGIAWQAPGFDDSGWSSGAAPLGYSNNGNRGEVTVVSFGDDADNKHVTTYFRTGFEFSGSDDLAGLVLRILFDDGVAAYLNGAEILRENLIPDASFEDLADPEVNGAAEYRSFNIPVTALQEGRNTLAVEIHQARRQSADISFDVELTATTAIPSLNPGINQVLVEAFDEEGTSIGRRNVDIWFDSGEPTVFSGEIPEDTTWSASGGPYLVAGDIVVAAGVTLVIEPGTTVYFANGTRMTVRGRLLADGEPGSPVVFTQQPGVDEGWEGLHFESTLDDNRMSNLVQDGADAGTSSIVVNGSRLHLDGVSWTGTEKTIMDVMHPQVLVTGCEFPATPGQDVIRGTALDGADFFSLQDNTFEASPGGNDIIHFSGGRRPGPIIHVVGNIFKGAADDCLDLDGADAHIEGNIFRNVRAGDPAGEGSANAISASSGSHLTVVRNLFNGIDHALLLGEDSDAVFENNTVVNATISAINFKESGTDGAAPGRGISMGGNIFWNNTKIMENHLGDAEDGAVPDIAAALNILPLKYHGFGEGNIAADPRFEDFAGGDFHLVAASPAIGRGINGADMGYTVAPGAHLSGIPPALGRGKSARIIVHMAGISGIEDGDFTSEYRWRLDGGQWSEPVPVANAIILENLADGSHFVEVLGKDSAGYWQAESEATRSQPWVVDSTLNRLLISEVLADNGGIFDHEGTFPDFIEIWNDSPDPRDISRMVLSDRGDPDKGWSFPQGSVIAPGGYLVVFANDQDFTSGLHCGFGLDNDGESVYLFDAPARGGALVDRVDFGFQLTGRSIGRDASGLGFSAMVPTPGSINTAPIPMGLADRVLINEWLATSRVVYDNDFLELYNPESLPVELSGMMISDDPNNRPARHVVAPLSFIDGGGFVEFIADSDPSGGANHLSFRLSKLIDQVAIFNQSGIELDRVQFFNSPEDSSVGRATDGSLLFSAFVPPTPGFSNSADLQDEQLLLQNLRITELMYNPPGGSAWEFVRVENTGSSVIRLAGVALTEGISFQFPDIALGAGEGAYIVRDTAAFRARNGGAVIVLGEYEGKLDNGGERLRLELVPNGLGILDFEYDDEWYPGTDGGGQLLQVINARAGASTWGERGSWRAVEGDNTVDYSDWVSINFGGDIPGITGQSDDPDGDGMVNLAEFVFQLDPSRPDPQAALPQATLSRQGLTLTYTTVHLPEGISVTPELSGDLDTWTDAGDDVTVEMLADDGVSSTYRVRLKELPGSVEARFMRLRVNSP